MMSSQLTLDYTKPITKAEKFAEFNKSNPQVLENLERIGMRLINRGINHFGIGFLFEVLRWEYLTQTTDTDFKLNNNYRSHYARLLIERNPSWNSIIHLRNLRST